LNIQTVANPILVPDARRWTKILARYRRPSELRSTLEIAITFVPLATLWVLAWAALHFGYWWLSLLLAMPAAGFLVRLFMIQHDCGHGSFFVIAWQTIGLVG
jgi:acyl-lipid omega-6 desaturase (Delta-12 desaturase)